MKLGIIGANKTAWNRKVSALSRQELCKVLHFGTRKTV